MNPSKRKRPVADPSVDPQSWRRHNVGRLLNRAIARFEARVLAILADVGFADVRLAHVGLTRNLDFEGTRATEMATRATMTKQAMSELVAQCEAIGLVMRTQDPSDARAKVVRFTPRGLEFMEGFRRAVLLAQDEMSAELGRDRVEALVTLLKDYVEPPEA